MVYSKVVVKFDTMTWNRIVSLITRVALPRLLFIPIVLGIVGTRYLAVTANMEDLLLNVMALVFIIQIAEAYSEAACYKSR